MIEDATLQIEFALAPGKVGNCEWFVEYLEGRDWITASEMLIELGQKPVTENKKRRLRALADASGGRICGHQRGYKLTRSMTGDEYNWWRNEILKIADALRGRVLESDRIFYGRSPH